jgi:predicted amidohydrolase
MKKKNLRIGILQFDIQWKDKNANLRSVQNALKQTRKRQDIIILPELFNTGFVTDDPMLAETEEGTTLSWMKERSVEHNCLFIGSIIIKEEGEYYNRLLAVKDTEIIFRYNKRHLFSLGGEARFFSAGNANERSSFEYLGWKLRAQICYDLRFPVWSRNDDDYDILITVANWPKQRIDAWLTLLEARAIENQCFSVGVNRLGTDGMGLEYPGKSAVFNPLGKVLLCSQEANLEMIEIFEKDILETRLKLPFLNDKDEFKIIK